MQNEVEHNHTRAHIRLTNQKEAIHFVNELSKKFDEYCIENKDGTRKVNAKSIIGLMYFIIDLNDEMYLVNETHDGLIPSSLDVYRVVA